MPDTPVTPHPLSPIAPAERNITIDVIRGFALLGILIVNLELFAHPMQRMIFPIDPQTGSADRVADWCVRLLAEGKFYSLFSFLFGLGFGLQLLRAEERGAKIGPLYTRRLGILLLIGLLHLFLVWAGDILAFYALAGFVLFFVRNAKPRTLLRWAVILLCLPVAFNLLGTLAVVGGRMAGPDVAAKIDRSFAAQDSMLRAQQAAAGEVYANGSYADITRQRARDAGFVGFGYLAMGPYILAMFLIGLYFARRGIFADTESHTPLLRRILRWSVPLGAAGSAVYATIIQGVPRSVPDIPLLIAMVGYGVGVPALSLAYMSGITLLLRRPVWKERLQPLAAAGRIPLSNYLAQSVLGTMIFYGYGLGFFGQSGRSVEILLAFALYALLVTLSMWWTKRFRYGPMEWVWRRLTYGRQL